MELNARTAEAVAVAADPPECTVCGLPPLGSLTEERTAKIAQGLAHPARVRILEQFAAGPPRMVQDIAAQCPLAQSTVSEHLRILRRGRSVVRPQGRPPNVVLPAASGPRQFVTAIGDLAVIR